MLFRSLDLHNLLGIVTVTWALVVGATGMINAWADLVVAHWRGEQVARLQSHDRGLLPPGQPGSLEKAVANARQREPRMKIAFIAFPGTAWGGDHHYGVFMRGPTRLTERLLQPVLVDAVTGEVSSSQAAPWYMTTLLLAQPLHFGDYGGVPMQWLWAVLDVITLLVLGSGLYLWLDKRGPVRKPMPAKVERSAA